MIPHSPASVHLLEFFFVLSLLANSTLQTPPFQESSAVLTSVHIFFQPIFPSPRVMLRTVVCNRSSGSSLPVFLPPFSSFDSPSLHKFPNPFSEGTCRASPSPHPRLFSGSHRASFFTFSHFSRISFSSYSTASKSFLLLTSVFYGNIFTVPFNTSRFPPLFRHSPPPIFRRIFARTFTSSRRRQLR